MNKQRGFGLAETLIASVLLSFLAVSFFALNNSIRTNIRAGNKRAVAAELAQQELESLRYRANEVWTDISPNTWDSELKTVNTSSQKIATIDGTVYNRIFSLVEATNHLPNLKQDGGTVSASEVSQVVRRVKVTITWQDGTRSRSYDLYSLITNWKPGLL